VILGLVLALAVLGLVGFVGYVGVIGSDQFLHPGGATDCRTPMDRFDWPYEAINYDITDDATLRTTNPDMTNCATQGTTAGSDVVTSDGVSIGGWYIPAVNGAGATATTVVLVHGYGDNKSGLLKYAALLHERFNVVAFDLRNGGRSGTGNTTFGVDEQHDLEAIIDWLVRERLRPTSPSWATRWVAGPPSSRRPTTPGSKRSSSTRRTPGSSRSSTGGWRSMRACRPFRRSGR
jgi:hypothetical protein